MALKDLKSDLSKFRMPKNDPLVDKKIDSVNTKTNQTPLSSMVDSAPKIPRSTTTTNKEGVNPQKMDNSSKFLGETTPSKMDNTSNFLGETTPQKVDNSSNFLGETTPSKSNLEERFLGETTPSKADNSEQFLGETTPTKSNLEERFLGETTPTKSNLEERFLGETTPTPSDKQSQFLGETTPNKADISSKFLGETDPNRFDNTSNFLGETTPSPANNESRFLGETTPSPANNESRFLGETTPTLSDRESNFLGETTPTPFSNTSNFLGETTPTPSNKESNFLGETDPTKFEFNPNHSDNGVTPTNVNYFQDIHAKGFTSNFGGVDDTKFIGVNPNNTVFNSTNSRYSNIDDSTFTLGRTYEQSFDSAGRLNSGDTGFGIGKGQAKRNSPSFLDLQYAKFNLKDDSPNSGLGVFRHPLILRGIQRKGISKGEPQSWGVLGVTFDDGLIRGGAITSTVRAVIDAARIGSWMLSVEGLLWGVKQFGLQQSNPNVESVTGARLTKIWTPINTLASIAGQHIGLHPRRHGLLPLPEKVGPEKYENVQKAKAITHRLGGDTTLGLPITGNRLVGLYNESFFTLGGDTTSIGFKGMPFLRLQGLGGPNSLYGLIPGGRVPTRDEDTRLDYFEGYTIQNQYGQYYSGNAPLSTKLNDVLGKSKLLGVKSIEENFRDKTEIGTSIKPYTEYKPIRNPSSDKNEDSNDRTGNNRAGAIYSDEYTYEENREDLEGNDLAIIRDVVADTTDINVNLNTTDTHTTYGNPFSKQINELGDIHDLNVNTTSGEIVRRYETVAYGNIPNRIAGDIELNDFRSLLTGNEAQRAELEEYSTNNINKRVNFGNPGQLPTSDNDRIEWWNTDKTKGGTGNKNDRYDKINALDVGESPDENTGGDLVNMWFQAEGGKKVQFRGTAKGITETFSPSWDSIKYNGRADQAYKYTTFERSVSFNFQVYATSRIEMKPIWKKLQYLSTMTMPEYGKTNGYHGTLVYFKLGSLYGTNSTGKLAFIESLSYTMSDETPWEISMLGSEEPIGELPMGIDVSIGLKILGNVRPELGKKVYDWEF